MVRKPMWLVGKTAEWMERYWREGWSSELLSQELEEQTGIVLSNRVIGDVCTTMFGKRRAATIYIKPSETRAQRCLRCLVVKQIARPLFICDRCHDLEPPPGPDEGYRVVGARMR